MVACLRASAAVVCVAAAGTSASAQASTIFGATAAIMRVKRLDAGLTAHALGIAGSISPVNSHMA